MAGGGEGIPLPKGEIGGPLGGQKIKSERGQVSPAHLGSLEPAEIPGLILCPLRPTPAIWLLREWKGGEGGAKVKARPTRLASLRGSWGRGGVPTSSGIHPLLGVQRQRGIPWGRQGLGGSGGTEENAASAFPAHLGTGEAVGSWA